MKRYAWSDRTPWPKSTPPHTHRQRHLRDEERDADALAQVRRARLTWDDIEPLEKAA